MHSEFSKHLWSIENNSLFKTRYQLTPFLIIVNYFLSSIYCMGWLLLLSLLSVSEQVHLLLLPLLQIVDQLLAKFDHNLGHKMSFDQCQAMLDHNLCCRQSNNCLQLSWKQRIHSLQKLHRNRDNWLLHLSIQMLLYSEMNLEFLENYLLPISQKVHNNSNMTPS